MPGSEKSTRQRLIDAAVQRFYRDGFRNVGIDQIYSDVGISKTAFYKHFESKDDLMLAVVEDQTRWLRESMQEVILRRGGPTTVGQLRALFDLVEQITEKENFHGCIFVNVTMEFPLPHEPVHIAARNAKQAFEEAVCQIAQRGQALDPRAAARELCLVMEGAYVTRHVTGDPTTISAARQIAELILSRHFPSADPLTAERSPPNRNSD